MSLLEINNIIDSEVFKLIKKNKSCNILEKCNSIIKNNKSIDKNIIDKRIEILHNNIIILNDLRKIPIIEQRTKEWYDARDTRLTAKLG